MIAVRYAMGTQPVNLPNGSRAIVRKGSHWPADDPVVAAAPELFSSDPRWGLMYSVEPEGYDAPIETATANPGERRNTRRPSS